MGKDDSDADLNQTPSDQWRGKSKHNERFQHLLKGVLERIASGTVDEKTSAIKQLRQILNQSQDSPEFDSLNNKNFHEIFESVFLFVKKENAAYLRTNKSRSRNNAGDRLSVAASVLRVVIKTSLFKIQLNTVNAVIDHVLDCLPDQTGAIFCPPLRNDYLKGLQLILQHRPHLEHLRSPKVTKLIDFCLSGLNDVFEDQSTSFSTQQQGNGDGSVASSTQVSRNKSFTSLPISQRGVSQKSGSDLTAISEELIVILEALSTTSRHALSRKSEAIFNSLLIFLSSMPNSKVSHAAWGTINNLLKTARTEEIVLAGRILDAFLPLIARLWRVTKKGSLQDEMLLTLLHGIEILKAEAPPGTRNDRSQAMENVIESFQIEYSKRKKEDLLQIDDLTFFNTQNALEIDLFGIAPRCNNDRSFAKWMASSVLANLICILDTIQSTSAPDNEANGDDGSLDKRRRLARPLDDLLRSAVTQAGTERVQALQLIPHMLQASVQTTRLFADRFDEFLSGALEDNVSISSWSMIAIASFACHHEISDIPRFERPWSRVWHAATRNIATPACSRAACFLLTTLLRSKLLNTTEALDMSNETVLSSGINSLPPALTDASMALYQSVVQLHLQSSQTVVAESSAATVAIQWINTTWTSGNLSDRSQIRSVAANVTPAAMLNLLSTCMSRQDCFSMISQVAPESNLFKAWVSQENERELTNYLLLKGADKYRPYTTKSTLCHKTFIDVKKTRQIDSLVLQMMLSKLKQVTEAWMAFQSERILQPNEHDVQVIVCLWTVARALVLTWTPSLPSLCSDLMKESEVIERQMNDFVSRKGLESALALASSLSVLVTLPASTGSLTDAIKPLVAPAFELSRQRPSIETADDPEFTSQTDQMDSEEPLTPRQSSQTNRQETLDAYIREHVTDSLELYFRPSTVLTQLFVSHVLMGKDEESSPDEIARSIDFLTRLSPYDFLESRNAVLKILLTRDVPRDEACHLLKYLGEELLGNYELERCESVMCLCVEVLTMTASMWISEVEDDLSDSGIQLYQWFTEDVMDNGFATPQVLQCITMLLQKVMGINPAFSSHPSGPSPRTSLFRVLSDNSNTVKFKAGRAIPRLFGQFVLTEHSAMFSDVVHSLPDISLGIEGLALRLDVLSQLGQQWHTVRQAAIYHIFETSSIYDQIVPYAKHCLGAIAEKISLKDLHELFRLFAPHLLNNLLDHGMITSIPYAAFDYISLQDLLLDVLDEAVAQIAMRGSETNLQALSDVLHSSPQELLSSNFSKVEVYCLARDICLPPSQELNKKSTETLMRKRLGNEFADSLTQRHFAEIVSGLILGMDQEHHIEKAFAKRSEYSIARKVLHAINNVGSVQASISSSHQPSFRAKYILDELDFLCKRIALDSSSLWSPSMTVFVIRRMIDSLHPALGPFHACAILRKIKIVVCLAGSTVCHGYPLEQLLRAIRPFLTDFYTSAEAIGLFQYLLSEGKSHLVHNHSFLSGLTISTFMALRDFLVSPQDSTTQESLFKEVISSAESFRVWFIKYLDSCSSIIASDVQGLFRQIFRAASNVKTGGSAIEGTHEGALLATLLEDQCSASPLLLQPTFDSTIENLCKSFSQPAGFREDIVNDDSLALKYAPILWDVANRTITGDDFRIWVARVLGRSYASSGHISNSLTDEHDRELFASAPTSETSDTSNVAIVQKILFLLSSENQHAVGIAERTLHTIISKNIEVGDREPYGHVLGNALLAAMSWAPLPSPQMKLQHPGSLIVNSTTCWDSQSNVEEWVSQFSLNLAVRTSQDPTINGLSSILFELPDLAVRMLPYLVHSVLLAGQSSSADLSSFISHTFRDALRERPQSCRRQLRLILSTFLYLRKQPFPRESTILDREKWIDLDVSDLTAAAAMCRMYKSALMILELQTPQNSRSSRRSSQHKIALPPQLLQEIFENLEDPDYFYGLQQTPSISSIIKKLDYEGSGLKALSFQSAQFDSDIKLAPNQELGSNTSGVVRSLSSAAFDGIANIVSRSSISRMSATSKATFAPAPLNLHEWDLPTLSSSSSSGALFKALTSIDSAREDVTVPTILNESLGVVFDILTQKNAFGRTLHNALSSLGALSELSDIWGCRGNIDLEDYMTILQGRNNKTHIESFDYISSILAARDATFCSLRTQPHLQRRMGLTKRDAHFLEVKIIRETLRMSRKLEAPQPALNSAIYMSRLVGCSADVGLDIQAVSSLDLAKVLWDQDEKAVSIQMLQELCERNDLHKQSIPISRAQLLADLGHQSSEARLEDPQDHIERYLLPAIKELKGDSEGPVPGRVYHEFASYCDGRLQNPDDVEDFERTKKLSLRKEQEVDDYEKAIKDANSKQKEQLKYHLNKAKLWYKLDDQEYQRKKKIRENLIHRCLENYLLALKACDNHDNDVLRFCALWLDESHSENANEVVGRQINDIASRKFAPLMNQLSSRLQNATDSFQPLLFRLITRICRDHPYHGMYQIFATSKARHGREDAAVSRHAAANKIAETLHKDERTASLWVAIHNASSTFIRFANERPDDKKQGKFPIRSLASGQRMETETLQVKVKLPPPTLRIELRADCDYSSLPRIAKYDSNFTLASGVSIPKIVTLVGSDGKRYKQLFKGGNDDLRQDAIMEQVFEQVSNLLKVHRETRRRNLGIRTYKVLPLHTNAGIIEFVQNTVPLHDYLLPAHQRYNPKDMKPTACRKAIGDADKRSTDHRIQVFRKVTEKFQPVLRYFFFERFPNPDDWFVKRLAYSRTTAAISILGHVLGLGDRHGHNILLDEKTGEVVHIDLGVAFEAGRVLPVPEVVPFRLTRDLVDGMGITKTEGVFRRCCNFTLEALRKESYSIMTVLDVLRYDPLYSWSLSPLRMKRMQETDKNAAAEEGEDKKTTATATTTTTRSTTSASHAGGAGEAKKQEVNEPSEADRALTVVAKKLGKSLSVEATVNELIQQATDERNLAVLWCGWAAYA